MAFTIQSPNTGTTLAAENAASIRKLWETGLMLSEANEDWWQDMEGTGEDSFIVTKTDTAKGKGHTITFTTTGNFYKRGKSGEMYFEDSADFEVEHINSFNLRVDYLGNAVRITGRTEEEMGFRGQLKARQPLKLGGWMGREKAYKQDKTFMLLGQGRNYMCAGGRGSVDLLTKDDVLTYDELLSMGAQLKRVGGKAAVRKTVNGNFVHAYALVSTTDGLLGLKRGSAYQNMLDQAAERGDGNPLFTGGYKNLDGHMIKERHVIDHPDPGPIGSTLNPRALLGEAITAGTTEFNIKGGGSAANAAITYTDYFRNFPLFATEFTPDNIHTPADDPSFGSYFYVAIVNPPGDANAGKFGFYKIDGNTQSSNLNVLTVDERLGSAASGDRLTTVGNVTWDATVNTDAHPIGSSVFLCNANGVPIGASIMLGRQCAYRGYGKDRNLVEKERHNGTFIEDTLIRSVFGTALVKDQAGRYPGYMVLWHAVEYPGEKITPALA